MRKIRAIRVNYNTLLLISGAAHDMESLDGGFPELRVAPVLRLEEHNMKNLAVFGFLFLIGCSSIQTDILKTDLGAEIELPPWEGPVEVYFEEPPQSYERLGIVSVQARARTRGKSIPELINVLCKEAASIGATGLIVHEPIISRWIYLTGTAILVVNPMH